MHPQLFRSFLCLSSLIFSHDDAESGVKIPVGCGRPSIKLLRLSMESSDEEKDIFVIKDRWRCRDEIEEGVKDEWKKCCGAGSEMNSYQGCTEYTKKIYWCVACKEYCCLQCVISNADSEKRASDGHTFGKNILCNRHGEECRHYGHEISYPEPLPPLVEDTRWHQLLRRNIRNPSKESMESEEAGFELPCYWHRDPNGKGLGYEPASNSYWVRTILHKESDDKWLMYDAQKSKIYDTITWTNMPKGLRNLWNHWFKYPGIEQRIKMECGKGDNSSKSPAKKRAKAPQRTTAPQGKSSSIYDKYYTEAVANTALFGNDSDESDDDNMGELTSTMEGGQGKKSNQRGKSNQRVKQKLATSHLRDSRLAHNHRATSKAAAAASVPAAAAAQGDDDSSVSSTESDDQPETPSEFIARLNTRMVKKLSKKNHKNDNNSFSSATLRSALVQVSTVKIALKLEALQLDGDVDGESFSSIIDSCIPSTVNVKIGKDDVVNKLVLAWSLTRYLVGDGENQIQLKREHQRVYSQFSSIMSRIEAACDSDVQMEGCNDKGFRSVRLSSEEMQRNYLKQAGSKKCNLPCAFCNCSPSFTDEPPSNKEKAKRNRKAEAMYVKNAEIIQKHREGDGPPLRDDKGNVMTNQKSLKTEEEVIMCHCIEQNPGCACRFVCPKS